MASTRCRGLLATCVACVLVVVAACAVVSVVGTSPKVGSEPGSNEPVDKQGTADDSERSQNDGDAREGAAADAVLEGKLDVLAAPEGTRRFEVPSRIDRVASALVGVYRKTHVCLVREAGYLDLLGDVWGCVMEGPGWVDLCLVSASDDEQGSAVSVERTNVLGEGDAHAMADGV